MMAETPHLKIDVQRVADTARHSLDDLVIESQAGGFRFLRRLVDDWNQGTNRFSQPGEALLVAVHDDRAVGVCGLNVDPYFGSATVARIRHLYVSTKFRRLRVGARLINEIISIARGLFTTLRLFTDSQEAARFYDALGFKSRNDLPRCAHVLELDGATD